MAAMKKLFISHASEDKDAVVRELVEKLKKDFDVWYDEDKLVVGTSIFDEINKGISECDYGIIILSPHFFDKKWTNEELKGLFAREEKDRKVILPVWYKVDVEDIKRKYPVLADRKASLAKDGIDKIISDIKLAIDYFEKGRASEKSTEGFTKLRNVLLDRKEKGRSEEILRMPDGVQLVRMASHSIIKYFHECAKILKESELGPMRIDGPIYDDYNSKCTVQIGAYYLHTEYYNDVENSAFGSRMIMQIGKKARYGSAVEPSQQQVYTPYITLLDIVLWRATDETEPYSSEKLIDLWYGRYARALEKE
jgi:hypothetical protein